MTFRLRQKLLMAACVALIVMGTASSSQAGLIPWLVDSLFGPSCSPYASRGYNPGYQPYGSANCYVPRVSTPPCYATSYATAPRYTQTCYPRRFLFPPLLPALFGGCRQPCAPSAGYRFGGCSPYGYGGCPPYGYGGCPVTLPAQPTASKGDGWSKTQPRTFVPDSSAKTVDKVDTRTFRPPTDVDPGEVIPQVEKPATVIPAGAEKKNRRSSRLRRLRRPSLMRLRIPLQRCCAGNRALPGGWFPGRSGWRECLSRDGCRMLLSGGGP